MVEMRLAYAMNEFLPLLLSSSLSLSACACVCVFLPRTLIRCLDCNELGLGNANRFEYRYRFDKSHRIVVRSYDSPCAIRISCTVVQIEHDMQQALHSKEIHFNQFVSWIVINSLKNMQIVDRIDVRLMRSEPINDDFIFYSLLDILAPLRFGTTSFSI